MKQIELMGNSVKLISDGNVLALVSDRPFSTVSSAIYNGGCRKTKTVLNVQVPEGYGDLQLHQSPEVLVLDSAKKLGLTDDCVAIITAAVVENFSLVTKSDGDVTVSVITTAGCSHAESAGEEIRVKQIEGTINIIILVDGNPVESCLVSALATATEAKTAALRELDIRSRYTGDEATGTITDSIVVAATNRGPVINYGGPASKLGLLVGFCTRKAVKEAVVKANECVPNRSIQERLSERHLPVEKIAHQLSKIKSLNADEKTLTATLNKLLNDDPVFASILFAAVKINEDFQKGLVPMQLGRIDTLGQNWGKLYQRTQENRPVKADSNAEECDSVDLPPFLKQVLIGMVKTALLAGETENLK